MAPNRLFYQLLLVALVLLCFMIHVWWLDPSSVTVWLKYCVASSCLAMIGAEQSTEALPPYHWSRLVTPCPLPHDQLVVETLMIALRMIVG